MNPKIGSFQSGEFIHQRIRAGMTMDSPCPSLPEPTPTPEPPLPPDPSPFPGPPLPEPAPTPNPPPPPDPSPFPGPPVTIGQFTHLLSYYPNDQNDALDCCFYTLRPLSRPLHLLAVGETSANPSRLGALGDLMNLR